MNLRTKYEKYELMVLKSENKIHLSFFLTISLLAIIVMNTELD